MRKFFIRNSKNETRELNNESRIMLANPSGLGFTMERDYSEISDGFFKSSKDGEEQGNFSCDLIFTGSNPYYDYHEFLKWLIPGDNVTLIYSPYEGAVYNCIMQTEYVQKTEINSAGVLSCPSSFFCVSPWFSPRNYSFIVDPELESASRFDDADFDDGVFTKSATLSYIAIIDPIGHVPASLLFEFTGDVTNPILSLVGKNTGTVYGVCELSTTLADGDVLMYSSEPYDSYVRKIHNGAVYDLEDAIVPGTPAYFSIPTTEPCDLIFDGDTTPSGTIRGQVRYYYRSV